MFSSVSLGALLFASSLAAQSPAFDLTTIPTTTTPQSLIAGDFNRDGKPDLAVSGSDAGNKGTVEILLGQGDGTFRSTVIPLGAPATRIAKADFNGDGKLDLAVSVGDHGQVVILLGNGDGTFQAPVDSGANAPTGQLAVTVPGLSIADVNGDGKPDLVLGPYTLISSLSVAVLLGNGDGTFQTPIASALNRVDSPQIAVGDLNGDGRADAFVTGTSIPGGRTYQQLLGNADGSMSLTVSKESYKFVFIAPMTMADIDRDGKNDVVVLTWLDYPDYGVLTPRVFLGGALTSEVGCCDARIPIDSHAGLETVSMTAADVTGDGNPDLLLSDPFGNLAVWQGSGNRDFVGPQGGYPPVSPSPTIYTGSTSQFNDRYGSIATADFRGVGKQDVVLALAGKSVSLLKNTAGPAPSVSAAQVRNAASLTIAAAVPGSLVTVFGDNLAYGTGTTQDPTISFSQTPETLFGVTIQVNGFDAPLLYASPQQANIQIPASATGPATLTISRNGTSRTLSIPLVPYAPGLFSMNAQGSGQAAALIAPTSAIPATAGEFPDSRPAHRGEYVSLYATGLGATTSIGALQHTSTTPLVSIDGVPATVQFSGLAPGLVGVYQINIRIPDDAPAGTAVPISLTIGGATSNTVTIAIQ
jgi:uncharacterized protein (TIGR03437 family)